MRKKVVEKQDKKAKKSLLKLLRPYLFSVILIIVLTVISNGLNLAVPQMIAIAIDNFTRNELNLNTLIWQFGLVSLAIFILTYLQGVVQTYAAETVARDLRKELSTKISTQDFAFIIQANPSKLLTNLTSDVDAVKTFVSQAISSIISSIFLIIGASVLLLIINWPLALTVLATLPLIGFSFFLIFSKIRKLFKESQEAIDWLNKVINESILGAALIRIFNSQQTEYAKFLNANTAAKNVSLSILQLFASLIPVITFVTNLATLIILLLGGHFVINGSMSLGSFTAFNSYLAILIFPILILSFMSNVIAQASSSLERIAEVTDLPPKPEEGTFVGKLDGNIAVKNVTLRLAGKLILKDINLLIKGGTRTAIIGPTAAGKTQLLNLLVGLQEPTSGTIEYDGKNLDQFNKKSLHQQLGFVFQDSTLFNLSLKENIAFSNTVTDQSLEKAVETAELSDFIDTLPDKLMTIVSERGTSLSGGQKQRIMLARALAVDPKILFLDDFTARVDRNTEQKVLSNVAKNYPKTTIISVTQKISAVEDYDQIILMMEGEILIAGTHQELMEKSPEYIQIYNSQQSTNNYEIHSK